MKLHLSIGNSKMGNVINFSFPAGSTCRPDAPCMKDCYACKGHFRRGSVKTAYEENLEFYQSSPIGLKVAIVDELQKRKNKEYFRWFVSGDLPDIWFFSAFVVDIAKLFPETKFLLFTKRYEFVNEWLSYGNRIPDNLSVVLSHLGTWHPENPYNLPCSYVEFDDAELNDAIPSDAYVCPKFCGECHATDGGCWNRKCGESVVFHQH